MFVWAMFDPNGDGNVSGLRRGDHRTGLLFVGINIAAFGLAYVLCAARLYSSFPRAYVWGEALINYAGGFVRRGLLGDMAYRIDWLLPAPLFVVILLVALYLFVATWFVVAANRMGTFGALLFIASPAGLLFPLLDFEAFGRKDIFIVAALIGVAIIARHAPRFALPAALAIFAVAGLVVETAWFYFPFAIAILISATEIEDWRKQITFWLIAALFAAAVFAAIEMLGQATADTQGAILHSWQARYTAVDKLVALRYVGIPVSAAIGLVMANKATASGYLIGFGLALIPLLVIATERSYRSAGALSWTLRLGAVACMFVPFVVAADWGRYIHLFVMSIAIFLLSVPSKPRTADANAKSSISAAVAGSICILLYAGMWSLAHFVPEGSALQPGPIFWLAGH